MESPMLRAMVTAASMKPEQKEDTPKKETKVKAKDEGPLVSRLSCVAL